jgi:hypothetical protein
MQTNCYEFHLRLIFISEYLFNSILTLTLGAALNFQYFRQFILVFILKVVLAKTMRTVVGKGATFPGAVIRQKTSLMGSFHAKSTTDGTRHLYLCTQVSSPNQLTCFQRISVFVQCSENCRANFTWFPLVLRIELHECFNNGVKC